MAKPLPERAFHQYVPLDTPYAVNAFLDHWAPDMALWAESEIWPNLIVQTKARNIPMALINARMSEKSLQGWSKRRKSAESLFGCFDVILAGDEATANGLSWLLGKDIERSGSLKEAAPALPVNTAELTKLKAQIGERPVWCAASTHKGEEEIILAAHQLVLQKHPDAFLILAIRHPERRDEIRNNAYQLKLWDHLRSDKSEMSQHTSVLVFDTIGEMGLAYSLSEITFVGGSLIKGLMGHNPIEPAQFSNAIITGEHIASFLDSYTAMFAFNAVQRILASDLREKVDTLDNMISNLFSDTEALARQQRLAFDFAQSRNAVLDVVWDKLAPVLPEPIS